METTINNKTLEKLKYELVRDGIVDYETLEKAEELAKEMSSKGISVRRTLSISKRC